MHLIRAHDLKRPDFKISLPRIFNLQVITTFENNNDNIDTNGMRRFQRRNAISPMSNEATLLRVFSQDNFQSDASISNNIESQSDSFNHQKCVTSNLDLDVILKQIKKSKAAAAA